MWDTGLDFSVLDIVTMGFLKLVFLTEYRGGNMKPDNKMANTSWRDILFKI